MGERLEEQQLICRLIDHLIMYVFSKAQLHHGTLFISSLRTGGQAVSRVPSPVSFQGCWTGSVSV